MKLALLQISVFTYLFIMTGCGPIRLGSSSLNDPVPSGSPTFTGTFTVGSATGGVSIYHAGIGNYVVRLESFSVPSQSGLSLKVIGTSGTLSQALRGTTGNQNYTFITTEGSCFAQVKITSSAPADIGIANITSVGPCP